LGRAGQEQGCDAFQRIGTLFLRAVPDHVLKFGNKRERCAHTVNQQSAAGGLRASAVCLITRF
jgi:hypothetical protein